MPGHGKDQEGDVSEVFRVLFKSGCTYEVQARSFVDGVRCVTFYDDIGKECGYVSDESDVRAVRALSSFDVLVRDSKTGRFRRAT